MLLSHSLIIFWHHLLHIHLTNLNVCSINDYSIFTCLLTIKTDFFFFLDLQYKIF